MSVAHPRNLELLQHKMTGTHITVLTVVEGSSSFSMVRPDAYHLIRKKYTTSL